MIVYKRGSSNKVNLTDKMFKAKGGQANIYINGSTVYKVYHNKDESIPWAKIQELQKLTLDNILKPDEALFNKNKELIGFTMNYVDNTLPLCKLFTNDVWRRYNITTNIIKQLVDNMRETTSFIHKSGCIIIDGNEMNYLVDEKGLVIPYFIDVDSYLTPSFNKPSKVYIMPSIRDYHSPKISDLSDWFAFGVVTCQLFTGVHPFRGGHPDYKKSAMKERMKDGVSIFNKDAKLPPTVRDLSGIPSNYKDWYIDIFEKNKRVEPPILAGVVVVKPVSIQFITSNADFEIKKIQGFSSNILYHTTVYGNYIIKTEKALHIGKTRFPVSKGVEVVYPKISGQPVFVKINSELIMKEFGQDEVTTHIRCTDMFISDNVLFVRYKDNLMEIDFYSISGKLHPIIKKVWKIMENSSTIFSGVVHQSVLGKSYLTVPKAGSCINKAVPELDEYNIISAKCELGVCQVVGYKEGKYDKFIIVFGDNGSSYNLRKIKDIDDNTINFVTLDNGVVISITDDYMEVFHKNSNKITKISNSYTNSKTVLCKDGTSARFFTDNELYSIRMKK